MARILFSCTSGHGHYRPLLPLARAFGDAGHEVGFATARSLAASVEAQGFRPLPAGLDPTDSSAVFSSRFGQELRALPALERRAFTFSRKFATIEAPAKLDELDAAVTSWRPELIVHESADLAAPPVAAARGIPTVHHGFGRLVPDACYELGRGEIDELWNRVGVEPAPLAGMYAGPVVDICPREFQRQDIPADVQLVRLRPSSPAESGDALPRSVQTLPDRPTIYVTLGTIFNEAPVFRVVLEGLAAHDCNVIATIGRNADPGELGMLPANAIVEPYIAQSLLLPRCTATVGHGGSGSVLAALAEGLPLLLVPQGADQFDNARRCRELGAAQVLLPGDLTAAAVHDAVTDLLAVPSYRARARELADEIASMPAPAEVATALLTAIGLD